MNKMNYIFQLRNNGKGNTDYEIYVNTSAILSSQKDFSELCNQDELCFQISHQVEELWMRVIATTLLDIDDHMQKHNTLQALILFQRVHKIQKIMNDQLSILETIAPKDYQTIRENLGRGSGMESPGFKILLQMAPELWTTFKTCYLDKEKLTLAQIYDTEYSQCESYVIAEQMLEYDALFQSFRYFHLRLVDRTIGPRSISLKGRRTDALVISTSMQFFPPLWETRTQMTEAWSQQRQAQSYHSKKELPTVTCEH